MENHVKYAENIYFQGQDGSLYVNLFIPSELNWPEKGVTLRQESQLLTAGNQVYGGRSQNPSFQAAPTPAQVG